MMGRYVSIFFLILIGSIILLFIIASIFQDGGLVSIGIVITILLAAIITQLFYIIEFLKKRKF